MNNCRLYVLGAFRPGAVRGRCRFVAFTLVTVLAATCTAVQADETAADSPAKTMFLDPKHRISLGVAEQDMDAGIRATTEEFEPDPLKVSGLGIDDRDYSYFLDYRYRFAPRWAVVAGAYGYRDTGTRQAEREFNYDGVVFDSGVRLDSELEVDAYLLDAMYQVYRGERSEVSVGGGIHALDMGATLTGTLSIGDQQAQVARSGTTMLAPVPNIRVAGTWVLGERLALHALGGWLSANVDNYEGAFLYGHLRAAYALTDRVGVALGYQRTDIDITETRSRSELNFDVRLEGFTLTMTYAF